MGFSVSKPIDPGCKGFQFWQINNKRVCICSQALDSDDDGDVGPEIDNRDKGNQDEKQLIARPSHSRFGLAQMDYFIV